MPASELPDENAADPLDMEHDSPAILSGVFLRVQQALEKREAERAAAELQLMASMSEEPTLLSMGDSPTPFPP